MPHYYFHLRDGRHDLLDTEGVDCPHRKAAAAKALQQARCILSHDMIDGALDLSQRIDVENRKGKVVFSQSFGDAFSIGPAR